MRVVIALLLLSAPVRAGDAWPTWRGNPRQTGVAASALSTPLTLLWKQALGSPTRASPVIAGGRVYVGAQDGGVRALELATGAIAWTYATTGPVESSVCAAGPLGYVGSADRRLHAFALADGKPAWTCATREKVLGSPVRVGSLVIVGSYDQALHAVDAATGKPGWTYETDGYVHATPAVDGGQLVFGGCDGSLHVVQADGKPVRKIPVGAYVAGSAAVDAGRAYVGHYGNRFVCVDLAAGKVVWEYEPGHSPVFSSPALAADRVVFGARDRKVHCLSRNEGKLLWGRATRGRVDSSPVIAGDRVVVGSDDGVLRVLALSDGRELWTHDLGAPIPGAAAVADGRVVVAGADGTVWCFAEYQSGGAR